MVDNDLDEDDLPPPIGPHRRNILWAPLDLIGNAAQGLFIGVAGLVRGIGRGAGEAVRDVTGEQDPPPAAKTHHQGPHPVADPPKAEPPVEKK